MKSFDWVILAASFAIATAVETAAIAWFFSDPDNVLLVSIVAISFMAVGV